MSLVEIFVNDKPCKADTSKTLLDNLLANGIDIPHLCHNEALESYGGCGLCLVEVEGARRPLRACSVSVNEGMRVITSTPEIEKSRRTTLALIMSDHTGDCKAPCFMACPTHQDVQGYVGLIAQGRFSEALQVIKRDNPLPASIGRVCPHPCEEKCRRNYLEGAVSICSLKRFAADVGGEYIPKCKPKNSKKIAVVGAGPAGLSCAYFSAAEGYEVTVFEAQTKAGGMLRYGIPSYRLPKNIIDDEVACIEKMGVEFRYSQKLGKDFTVQSLKDEYDAVFLGTGAWRSTKLGCDGDGAEGVVGGIDMLYGVANSKITSMSGDVCVVGGGNTAIDTVRAAVRLGAENVTLVYRRTEAEMPAEPDEIRDAKAEGVNFRFLASPCEVVTKNGKAVGLKVQNMTLGEPDSSGRRKPVPVEGSTEIIPCGTVVSAIGQKVVSGDFDLVELTGKSTVSVDENTYMTSVDGVFAAGDVINKGPDIAVRAIAGGKYAARSIDCYIKGIAVPPELPVYSVNKNFDCGVLSGEPEICRNEQAMTPSETRRSNFGEVASTFTREQAMNEASRCLECGCSAVYSCELLPTARKYDAFSAIVDGKTRQSPKDKSHPFIIRDNNKCMLCGQCVRACKEISGTENLGFFGRGFSTVPMSAFDLPLNESKCISCGACASVCPTGALVMKSPAVKNPPLRFTEEKIVCTLCEKSCVMKKRMSLGKVVAMIPEKLGSSCSLGLFLPSVKEHLHDVTDNTQTGDIKSKLLGDMKNYKGKDLSALSLDDLVNM